MTVDGMRFAVIAKILEIIFPYYKFVDLTAARSFIATLNRLPNRLVEKTDDYACKDIHLSTAKYKNIN